MSNKRRMSIHESDSESEVEKPLKKAPRYNLRNLKKEDSIAELYDSDERDESDESGDDGDEDESYNESEDVSEDVSEDGDESENESEIESENDTESENESENEDESTEFKNLEKLTEIEMKVKRELMKESKNSALEFHKVVDYIHKNRINIVEILDTPMLIEDKALIYQMFEIFHMIPKFTQEYLEYQNILIKEIKRAKQKYQDFESLPKTNQLEYLENKTRLLSTVSNVPLDYKIMTLNADDHVKTCLYKEYLRMSQMSVLDEEKPKLEKWIDTCLRLPFRRCKEIPDNRSQFLRSMKECLDSSMYGLNQVKEQLLVFANARLSNPEMKDCTLGLVGPPGIGKTMIARLISKCLNIPFAQISCGGITDSDVLRGHSYTYIGSKSGEIVKTVCELGYSNGVILFDEFEKISNKSSITGLLLHILDPLQNSHFQDSYLGRDITVDLSKMWFVLSMNELPQDSALRDRIFAIHLKDYTKEEKFQIAKRHLIPNHIQNLKINPTDITFSEESIRYIISHYAESGIRSLNQILREIITKVSFLQQTDIPMSFTIRGMTTPYNIEIPAVNSLLTKPNDNTHLSMFL